VMWENKLDPITFYGAGLPGYLGVIPSIQVNSQPSRGNSSFAILLTGARPNATCYCVLGLQTAAIYFAGGFIWNSVDLVFVLSTDSSGNATLPLGIPQNPSLAGNTFYFQWVVADPAAVQGYAFTQGMAIKIY